MLAPVLSFFLVTGRRWDSFRKTPRKVHIKLNRVKGISNIIGYNIDSFNSMMCH